MLFSKFVLNETNQHNFSLWNFVDVSRKKNETISYHNLEDSEKVGLKLNIQKSKSMASGPTTSRQIDGETVEIVAGFIFGGSKITADGDCSHEINWCLLLRRRFWPI